jgi:hypothetical protein
VGSQELNSALRFMQVASWDTKVFRYYGVKMSSSGETLRANSLSREIHCIWKEFQKASRSKDGFTKECPLRLSVMSLILALLMVTLMVV